MMKGKQDKVSHLIAAMHEISAPGHSPLYRWMRQNHDRIAKELDGLRPSWRALAIRLGEMKIHDGTGKAPTPDGARGTWYRVRRDLAAARARQAKRQETAVTRQPGVVAANVTVPSASVSLSPGEPLHGGETGTAQPPRTKLDIRPARPRGEVSVQPPAPPSAAPASESETVTERSGESAEAQLQRVLDAMTAGTTPMPRIVPAGKKS